jgi:hypothetical protein
MICKSESRSWNEDDLYHEEVQQALPAIEDKI